MGATPVFTTKATKWAEQEGEVKEKSGYSTESVRGLILPQVGTKTLLPCLSLPPSLPSSQASTTTPSTSSLTTATKAVSFPMSTPFTHAPPPSLPSLPPSLPSPQASTTTPST